MTTISPAPLPRRVFEKMANIRRPHCVSIYLPMDIKGKEQNRHLAQATLKSCIKEVATQLAEFQMPQAQIEAYVAPLEAMLTNVSLWRNPSEGLAIFMDQENGMEYYQIPLSFSTRTYVANHFYLLPLLPLYHNDGMYYLLELSQDHIKLFEGSLLNFKDVFVEDFAPGRLEDAVGYDFEQKNLQVRSGHGAHGTYFHGHGDPKEKDRKELMQFLRKVDEGVRKAIINPSAPLVLACVDSLYAMYKETTAHPNLYGAYIPGDPEFRNNADRHRKSWTLIENYFDKEETKALEQFRELAHSTKTAFEINDILVAAHQGKINTLFIEEGSEVFGTYDMEMEQVSVSAKKEVHNTSLTHVAAMQTFMQGGKVYSLPQDAFPTGGKSMVALLRY